MRDGRVDRPEWGLAGRVATALPLSAIEGAAPASPSSPVPLPRGVDRGLVVAAVCVLASALVHICALYTAAVARPSADETRAGQRVYPVKRYAADAP